MLVNGIWQEAVLKDVLFVPNLTVNLFSASTVYEKGYDLTVRDFGQKSKLSKDGRVFAEMVSVGKLHKLLCRVELPMANVVANLATGPDSLQLWHERLGHQNKKHVQKFLKGIGTELTNDNEFCDGCAYGKAHRLSFGERNRAEKPGELIHSDVCGPMEIESLNRKRYFVTFKDDYSGYRSVSFIREKSEVKEKLEQFIMETKNSNELNVRELRTDGGSEYTDKDVQMILRKVGVKHTVTVPYTPEQNGTAERENRILVEAARSMIHGRELPRFLWAEAVNTAAYVINRTGPSRVEGKTPYELWFGKQAKFEHFKVFGTECFVHVPKQKRQKLDRKAVHGFLVGYEDVGGYRVFLPTERSVVISRDVVFKDERVAQSSVEIDLHERTGVLSAKNTVVCDAADDTKEQEEKNEDEVFGQRLRDRSTLRPVERYGNPVAMMAVYEPTTFEEAVKSSEWRQAMDEEISSLHENNTWELVEKPTDKVVIENRWVYRVKEKDDGYVDRYKARLVVKGFSQKEGIDYIETFSPVVRFDTIRTVLSVAATENLVLRQFDVKTAFLYGLVEEEIYMEQPIGYDDGSGRVCKLLRSLYGLKQAPRCWNARLKDFLMKCELRESSADPCLFYRETKKGKLILIVYVDDGLILASFDHDADELLKQLQSEFKVKKVVDVKNFLGIEITRSPEGDVLINQQAYIGKVLDRFNMTDCKPAKSPINVGWEAGGSKDVTGTVPYREAVGNLMYLMVVSRPDIAFALNVVSRVLDKPTEAHWKLVKRILRYIKGTQKSSLQYRSDDFCGLEVYSDADFAGDVDTRRSTSGVLCKYGGAAITWQSKRQLCVAQSTTEAEFVAASAAAKEAVWLKRLLNEIGAEVGETVLQVDNLSAIRLLKNPEFHQRTKHIDVRYHFVRDLVERGEIKVTYVATEEQVADVLTKALSSVKFEEMKLHLGLTNFTNSELFGNNK